MLLYNHRNGSYSGRSGKFGDTSIGYKVWHGLSNKFVSSALALDKLINPKGNRTFDYAGEGTVNYETGQHEDAIQDAIDGTTDSGSVGAGSGAWMLPSAKQSFDYVNADLAKQYGMSRSTAYMEALSNTAHQREVADLQAAGLNPVLSAGAGSGASGVSGAAVASSGSAGGGSGAADADDFLDGMIDIISGVVGVVSPKRANSAKAIANGARKLFT